MQAAQGVTVVKAAIPDATIMKEEVHATGVKVEVEEPKDLKKEAVAEESRVQDAANGSGKPARQQDSPENLIHVRNNQTAVFYARLGRRMLFGTEKPTQDTVIITGLGRATGTAVGAAALMCNDERVKAVSAKTELWESIPRNNRMANGNRTTALPPRRIPKITITLAKLPGASGGLSPMTTVSTAAAESPNTAGTVSA